MQRQLRNLYKKVYYERFYILLRSFDANFVKSCGCGYREFPEKLESILTEKPVRPNIIGNACYYQPFISIGNSSRIFHPQVPKTNGLVTKMQYGHMSKLILNFNGQVESHPSIYSTLYLPKNENWHLTLNGIRLKFLLQDTIRDSALAPFYYIRLYFEIDCSDVDMIILGYQMVNKLKRERTSRFSLLPRDMIKVILSFLIDI